MILDIVAAHASWSDNRLSISFDVVPEALSHLDLKTGEIFQDDATANLRKQMDKTIAAQLYVTWKDKNAAGEELPSEMRYLPPSRSGEPLISLVWRLPSDHLAAFHALVIGGRVPKRAVVFFPHDRLGFTWEPDGRGQTWDNESERTVPIENIRFDIPIAAPPLPDDAVWKVEIPEDADPAFFSDAAKVNYAVDRKLSSIETALGRVSMAVSLIAFLVLALALSRFWH
jgi:hypothetical protein